MIPKLTTIDQVTIQGAEAAHHLAVTLKAGWEQVWNRAPEIVATELNADLAKSGAIFQLNAQTATAINAILDLVDDERFTVRVPTSMPSGWELGQAGFIYTAPPIPDITDNPPAPQP
jgi:hypothetical protein